MPQVTDQRNTALAERCRIERALGRGGMADTAGGPAGVPADRLPDA